MLMSALQLCSKISWAKMHYYEPTKPVQPSHRFPKCPEELRTAMVLLTEETHAYKHKNSGVNLCPNKGTFLPSGSNNAGFPPTSSKMYIKENYLTYIL